jgi:ADP-ribosyl-[dinitrogen reductase] hydrolase
VNWIPNVDKKWEGKIGMTLCPGKFQPVSSTGAWDRQLDVDLDALVEMGVQTLISLVTNEDMTMLRVPTLGEETKNRGIEWMHLPLEDGSVPDESWITNAHEALSKVKTKIARGKIVVVHCMGGLSRAGIFVALHLWYSGLEMETAIASVRENRSQLCINEKQEMFLLAFPESKYPNLQSINYARGTIYVPEYTTEYTTELHAKMLASWAELRVKFLEDDWEDYQKNSDLPLSHTGWKSLKNCLYDPILRQLNYTVEEVTSWERDNRGRPFLFAVHNDVVDFRKYRMANHLSRPLKNLWREFYYRVDSLSIVLKSVIEFCNLNPTANISEVERHLFDHVSTKLSTCNDMNYQYVEGIDFEAEIDSIHTIDSITGQSTFDERMELHGDLRKKFTESMHHRIIIKSILDVLSRRLISVSYECQTVKLLKVWFTV